MSINGASTILGIASSVSYVAIGCILPTWGTGSLQMQNHYQRDPWIILTTSVNLVSWIFGFASWVISPAIGCKDPSAKYWPLLETKTTTTHSLPHSGTEHHRSVNNFWSYILGNLTADSLKTSMHEVLAAFSTRNGSNKLPTPSSKQARMECQRSLVLHHV